MNPKFFIIGIVAAFAIAVGIIGFAGSSIFDDVSGGGIFSPSEIPREITPIIIELEHILIQEVTERAAIVEVQFKVTNPNVKSVILQLIKYELYEDDVRIAISEIGSRPSGMVESSNYFTILNEQSTILKDKVTIKNTGNLPELWQALSNDNAKWKIKGEAFFSLSSITAGGENEITFEFTQEQ